ncbi:hypothetical protein GCM10028807_49850 [Spirosoma daeguense]
MMELERLKFLIGRFDHFYDTINNKCAVFLALNTFIVGGLVAAYPPLLEKVNCNFWLHANMSVLLLLGIIIMIIVTKALIPYLGQPTNSILFFGDISRFDHPAFADFSKTLSNEDELSDFRRQVHQLSIGLLAKFRKLRLVGQLMIAQFILFVPLIFMIVTNLKIK